MKTTQEQRCITEGRIGQCLTHLHGSSVTFIVHVVMYTERWQQMMSQDNVCDHYGFSETFPSRKHKWNSLFSCFIPVRITFIKQIYYNGMSWMFIEVIYLCGQTEHFICLHWLSSCGWSMEHVHLSFEDISLTECHVTIESCKWGCKWVI